MKVGGIGSSYLTSTHDTEVGDSGGPLFKLDFNSDACVTGNIKDEINHGEDNDGCGDDTKSTTAETVKNKIGGYWKK